MTDGFESIFKAVVIAVVGGVVAAVSNLFGRMRKLENRSVADFTNNERDQIELGEIKELLKCLPTIKSDIATLKADVGHLKERK